MKKLVKMVKLNNLQYNANRDPQVYRRCVNEAFRVQALLDGSGRARCTLTGADGKPLASGEVNLPGTWSGEVQFSEPGSRVVTLSVEAGGERHQEDLRLDVMEHAWEG